MKKNASFITLNGPLLKWLNNQLKISPIDLKGASDLSEGLTELITGDISTLILSLDGSPSENTEFMVDESIIYGLLDINPQTRTVTHNQEDIILTPKEFDILYFLAKNRGTVFTKEQIYNAVWSEDYLLSDSNIMSFIRKLRKKVEPKIGRAHV